MFLIRSFYSGVFISLLYTKHSVLLRTIKYSSCYQEQSLQQDMRNVSPLPVCYLALTFILAHLVYLLLFLLHHSGRTHLRLGLSFTVGTFQHTGALLYLRFVGTWVNKQHVLTGLQFQTTCMKELVSKAEAGTAKISFRKWIVQSLQGKNL